MTQSRVKESSLTNKSSGRREFLRNALGIGGAAVLMLTAASRRTLAESLVLGPEELEAARHAQQVPGASKPAAEATSVEAVVAHGCEGCEGYCTGSCSGTCSGMCSGYCSGSCSGTCSGSSS